MLSNTIQNLLDIFFFTCSRIRSMIAKRLNVYQQRQILVVLFFIVMLWFSNKNIAFAGSTDDDSRIEYSSIYAGNLDHQDSIYAASELVRLGYETRYNLSSHNRQVRWWSITGEYSEYPGETSDNADFLYYSTHGSSNSDTSTTRQFTKIYRYDDYWDSPIDLLYADGGDTSRISYIDDNGWRWKPYRSYSKWDNDLEWAVIAACNQLEHFYSLEDGAHEYGKTLLGYPRRMHSIWGYHEGAPEGYNTSGIDKDTNIITYFLNLAITPSTTAGGPYSVENAWERANEYYSENDWSGVFHQSNRGDAMWSPNYFNGYYVGDDTANNSYPDVKFVYGPNATIREVDW